MADMQETAASPGFHNHLAAGPHMMLASKPDSTAEDAQRAADFTHTAQQALSRYSDYHAALQDGYQVLGPDVPQDVYHFINWQEAMKNFDSSDPAHPSALLYEKAGNGYRFVGAMYSAPITTGEVGLNQRFPLSMAQWHAHINLCIPRMWTGWDSLLDDPRFGFQGSISTRSECQDAGGRFLPDAFGWMVHVLFGE
jgi:hypothetical protein